MYEIAIPAQVLTTKIVDVDKAEVSLVGAYILSKSNIKLTGICRCRISLISQNSESNFPLKSFCDTFIYEILVLNTRTDFWLKANYLSVVA